jgi:hypothetical protein
MKFRLVPPVTLSLLAFTATAAAAHDTVLPAGTLLQCTLNEPNFSANTVSIGDPVVCHLTRQVDFGLQAFPRGSYLVGHLDAAKDPGHFAGKGYLQLRFDRIGVLSGDVPINAKMIAAGKYKVDREERIDGKGHAKRDALEWMLPPLWPWKVLLLPARGPRPKLKGETVLTLRLMDDVEIPAEPLTGGYSVGRSSSEYWWNDAVPSNYSAPQVPAAPRPSTADNLQVAGAAKVAASSVTLATSATAPNVLVLRDGTSFLARSLQIDGDQLRYALADGSLHAVKLNEVDWTKTVQSNAENGTVLALTSASAAR